IRPAQDMVSVAQQWKGQTSPGSEGVIVCDCIKTGPEYLHVALREGIIEVTEPVPFSASVPRISFGIKPQDHCLAAEVCQADGGTVVRGDGEIRRRRPDCQHLRPPQQQAKHMYA